MGFSPRQVHYGFSVTKEMTMEHSWGKRVYTQLYLLVVGQALESHLDPAVYRSVILLPLCFLPEHWAELSI